MTTFRCTLERAVIRRLLLGPQRMATRPIHERSSYSAKIGTGRFNLYFEALSDVRMNAVMRASLSASKRTESLNRWPSLLHALPKSPSFLIVNFSHFRLYVDLRAGADDV